MAAVARGGDDTSVIDLLQRGLQAASGAGTHAAWSGDGRLIGESTWGDLSQVGRDIADGCEAARGSGPLRVDFDPDEPMGLGLGPEVPSVEVATGRPPPRDASVGTGAEVGVVDPDGTAAAAGVMAGMVATRLSTLDLDLHVDGAAMPFEGILEAIDACRDAGEQLTVTFDTSAPLTHWYAVEMPAAATLVALGAPAGAAGNDRDDAGVGASFDALCGRSLLWREPVPRLFLGAPGSVTCAHVDICPQVQLAHGLLGTKVLGIASHAATPRLCAEHCGADEGEGTIDEGATHVPTDRPLSPRQTRLLGDADVSLILLRQGDLAVFHSGAIHFASNGADGLGGSLYHGVITPAAVPRLRADAAAPGGARPGGDEAYGEHLFAADLLQMVEGPAMPEGPDPEA